jgi:hypothetical protein
MLTNIDYKIEGNKLLIEVDLDKDFGFSDSKNSVRVATSHGFQQLDYGNGVGFSLNVNKSGLDG